MFTEGSVETKECSICSFDFLCSVLLVSTVLLAQNVISEATVWKRPSTVLPKLRHNYSFEVNVYAVFPFWRQPQTLVGSWSEAKVSVSSFLSRYAHVVVCVRFSLRRCFC